MERRSMKRGAVRVETVLLSVIGVAAVACSRIRAPEDGSAVRHTAEVPCALPEAREYGLVGKIASIPEFHDCQELATGDPAGYGPLVGIFVTRDFALRDSSDRAPDSTDKVTPRAVIRNFGPGAYTAGLLNFPEGFSCVWLSSEGGSWSATVTFVGATPDCSDRKGKQGQSVTLPASYPPRPPEPLGDRDYPRVARWQWDPAAHHHYFGIKCGSNWCQFGGSGEVPPNPSEVPEFTPIAGPVGPPDHQHRVKEVMGWYDQQDLAEVITVGGKRQLRPAVLARIFPHPQLDQVSLSDFGGWVQSAFVYMDGSLDKYEKGLHLNQGYTEIALCQGTSCPGLPAEQLQRCTISDADSRPGGETARKWFARIRPVRGANETNTFYHCVTKEQHPEIRIPGTARWRWSNDDEKIWIRCTNGCCTVV